MEKELSHEIVSAFFEVYNTLGFGFLEAIYSRALEIALRRRGILVEREVPFEVFFQGEKVGVHRVDQLVERRIVLEIKAGHSIVDANKRQLLNYITALNLELGILLHFGPRASFHRVLGVRRPAAARGDSDPFAQFVMTFFRPGHKKQPPRISPRR